MIGKLERKWERLEERFLTVCAVYERVLLRLLVLGFFTLELSRFVHLAVGCGTLRSFSFSGLADREPWLVKTVFASVARRLCRGFIIRLAEVSKQGGSSRIVVTRPAKNDYATASLLIFIPMGGPKAHIYSVGSRA